MIHAFLLQRVNSIDLVFSALLNRALAGTLLLLAAAVYRLVFPKAPKWTRLLVWALAAVRLCLPVSIKSVLSLVPSETVLDYQTAQYAARPKITTGIAAINSAVNPAFGDTFAAAPQASINPLQAAMFIAGLIWAAGVGIALILALARFVKLRLRVRASVCLEPGVRLCDDIDTPFLLGLLRPTIYLPSSLPEEERGCVLAHERSHLHHGDCLWKLLGYGIACVYWFYLPVWLGYSLFCRDLELACDERVVKGFDLEEKKRYARILLSCSVPRGSLSACPLAFGEVGVKERVKRILDKKPAKIVIALALAVCLVIGVCFLTSPKDSVIYGLSSGTYVMDETDAVQILPSHVTFRISDSRHEFIFMLSPVSSYHMAGDYTINDGFVTCSDGMYTLVFEIKDNDTIVLQIPNQDGLHMSGLFIPNGTEFHYEEPDDSRLTAYKQDMVAGEQNAAFRLSFGETLSYGEVWAEYWQNGVCVQSSETLELSRKDKTLHIQFLETYTNEKASQDFQFTAEADASGAVRTRFTTPEDMIGYGFKTYEEGTELPLREGETIILASLVPDRGDGIHIYNGTELAARPELYQEAPNIIVVKAMFGSILPLRMDGEIDLSDGITIRTTISQKNNEREFSHLVTNSTKITVSCDSIPEDAEVLISMYIEAQETPILAATLTSEEPSEVFTGRTVADQYKIRAVVKNCPEEITLTITD